MKPTCKKCGRVLHDPVSIMVGVGPCCRGASGTSKKVSKKHLAHQARASRTDAFRGGQPVTAGTDARTGAMVTYSPDGAGNWVSTTGQKMTEEQLKAYLVRYGLIEAERPAAVSP